MAYPKVKISDDSGNAVSVTSNRLDVNATLVAGATIDIGDVEITGHSTIGHGHNTAVSNSTAEVLTTSTACKHIDIMALDFLRYIEYTLMIKLPLYQKLKINWNY